MRNYVAFELEIIYCGIDIVTASPSEGIKEDNFEENNKGTFY